MASTRDYCCLRCGKIVLANEEARVVETYKAALHYIYDEEKFTLCPECYEKLRRFLKRDEPCENYSNRILGTQVADILGVSKHSVRRFVWDGRLKTFPERSKFGEYVTTLEWLEEFCANDKHKKYKENFEKWRKENHDC